MTRFIHNAAAAFAALLIVASTWARVLTVPPTHGADAGAAAILA